MSKHTEITQHLRAIEGGRFQIYCIDYLRNTVGGIVHSPGTVDGKEKSKTGHPDIYLKLNDGNYVLAECTTKDDSDTSEFIKKLKKDLNDCLNFEELAVPKEKISMIYLCCNSTVDAAIYEELEAIVAPFNIKFVIVGLHELATYFSSAGKAFAKDAMGIAFDTGQILTKEQFLIQYGKKNISTPLDNQILGREEELVQLGEQLNLHEIIILSGPGGVGKSRLAMEAMDLFVKSNPDYKPYYVFSKSGQITEDLATFLKPENSYILLIDDANRQIENLISILDKVIESEMRLKVILTVRDYAKQDVIQQCGKLDTCKFLLGAVDDEDIVSIISNDPFGIDNWKIIQRIVQISKGNPRLAIMAANIMKSNPELSLLSDVTKIYDEYFQTILTDNNIFNKKLTRQVIGLISYFYTLDIKEESDCRIIERFGFSVEEFIATAQELEELEVVEIYDHSVLKISEQVLATYFFYDSFLRGEVLSLSLLLKEYFDSHFYRVRDNFIAAIDAFGSENVISKNHYAWISYWNMIEGTRNKAIQFMAVFAPFFPDELFVLVSGYIESIVHEEKKRIGYKDLKQPLINDGRDEILNLLEIFYGDFNNNFETAIHLSFEYAIKQVNTISKLINRLKTKLFISKSDIGDNFQRIDFVYKYLQENFDNSPIYKLAFYYIMDSVILSPSGRRELYEKVNGVDSLKLNLKELRVRFLGDILENFQGDNDILFSFLLDYVNEKRDLTHLEVSADMPVILSIIDRYMGQGKFEHCYFVQEYICFVKLKVNNPPIELDDLLVKFNSPIYKLYALLSIKQDYTKQPISFENFFLQKTKVITSSINVDTLADWENIQNQLSIIFEFTKHSNGFSDGVSILLRDVLTNNLDLGFECLKSYLLRDNFLGLNAAGLYGPIFNSDVLASKKLYALINDIKFKYKDDWERSFFYFLPPEYINHQVVKDLIDYYKKYDSYTDIQVSHFNSYEVFAPGTVEEILNILVSNRLGNQNFVYKLWHNFFRDSPQLLDQNIELCKKVYFQQLEMPGTYDDESHELFVLIKNKNQFFGEYLDFFLDVEKHPHISDNKILNKIWEIDHCDEMVYDALVKISHINILHKDDHLGCIFFYGLKEEFHEAAYQVLSNLTENFPQDIKVLNTIIDILRNSLKHFYYTIIKQILSQNNDIEFFKRLKFHNNHFSTTTNEIWSEKTTKELKDLLAAILSMPNHYKFYQHKKYLNDRIIEENKYTSEERKDMFRGFR